MSSIMEKEIRLVYKAYSTGEYLAEECDRIMFALNQVKQPSKPAFWFLGINTVFTMRIQLDDVQKGAANFNEHLDILDNQLTSIGISHSFSKKLDLDYKDSWSSFANDYMNYGRYSDIEDLVNKAIIRLEIIRKDLYSVMNYLENLIDSIENESTQTSTTHDK